MRGRRPDPAEVKQAKGNPGKRRVGKAPEAAPGQDPAAAPAWLDTGARKIWAQIAPDLARMKLLTRTDAHAFGRYCTTFARWLEQSKLLTKERMTYESESQHGKLKRLNPTFLVVERLEKRLVDLEDRFGLNPAARQSLFAKLAQQAAAPGPLFGEPGEGKSDRPSAQPPAGAAIGFLAQGRLN